MGCAAARASATSARAASPSTALGLLGRGRLPHRVRQTVPTFDDAPHSERRAPEDEEARGSDSPCRGAHLRGGGGFGWPAHAQSARRARFARRARRRPRPGRREPGGGSRIRSKSCGAVSEGRTGVHDSRHAAARRGEGELDGTQDGECARAARGGAGSNARTRRGSAMRQVLQQAGAARRGWGGRGGADRGKALVHITSPLGAVVAGARQPRRHGRPALCLERSFV